MIVPDAIEPIVGWRCWSLNDHWRLESLFKGRESPWVPVPKEANCCDEFLARLRASWPPETIAELGLKPKDADLLREHQAPHESCWCGIYAANDLKTLRLISGPGPVVGEVYLWGKVIPGEFGYRAQYAYPKSLRLVTKGVPDDVLESLMAYCDDVGLMTPKEARGSWWMRALRLGLLLGRAMVSTRLGAIVILLALAAYRAFIA